MVAATEFTPVISLLGGMMIGASALLLMWSVGRIAGISGIVAGALTSGGAERSWRLAFIAGLFAGGVLAASTSDALEGVGPAASWPWLVVAGLVVGFGTRLGSGCTSGHGICGLSRFSKRSIWATITFMASGFATVFVLRHLI